MKNSKTLFRTALSCLKSKSAFLVYILTLLTMAPSLAQWQKIGGADVTSSVTYCSSMEVSSDGTPYVAFRDATSSNKVSVKKYNGSTWEYVGTAGFSAGIIDHTDIEIDASGVPYVCFTDASLTNKAVVMKFNGTSWVNVGTAGFTPNTAYGIKMDLSTTGLPYVCYIDGANSKVSVMRYNGTSWVAVGPAGIGMTNTVYADFSNIGIRANPLSIELDASSNVYVSAVEYVNQVTRIASVFKFNGTSWSYLPAVGTSGGLSVDVSIDPLTNQPYLVYTELSQGPLTVKKYNGTAWSTVVGTSSPFTGIASNVKIDFSNNKPVVANWNLSAGYRFDVYQFDGTNWNFVGGTVRPSTDSFLSTELAIDASGGIYVGGMRQQAGSYFQAFKYCTSVPTITLAPVTICGPDEATLSATASSGSIVSWFLTATTPTVLATGTSYTTGTLSVNSTYYAVSDIKGCASARASALVTVKQTPVVSNVTATTICGTSGTSTLTAVATSGSTINWYPIANAGLLSGTGSPFTTPVLTQNRNYYAEAVLNGCKSTPRVLVTVTLQTSVPVITSTTPGAVCGQASAQLAATSNIGIISWFATSTSTATLGTGTTFTTSPISANTTYYAEASSGACKSARVPVLAEFNTVVPTLSNLQVGPTRCDTGSVAMSASTNYGSVYWYNNGGTVLLDTGSTFNTPDITANAIFYVRAVYKGCVSPFQNAYANVVIPPTITGTTPATICQGQTFAQLSATSTGGGSIIWYADSTTTTSLFSSSQGVYNITSAPTTTKKYYVEGSRSGCNNGIRVPVTLTVKPLPAIITSTPASRCGAGTVTMTATSTSGTNVQWFLSSTDIVPAFTGTSFTTPSLSANKTYYLLPTSLNGCSLTTRTPIVATINQEPSSAVTMSGNTLTATESNASYQWINCTNSSNIQGATNRTYTPTVTGSYKVQVTSPNTCVVTSTCQNVTVIVTAIDEYSQSTLKVYPNPSHGQVFVEGASEGSQLIIVDVLGNEVVRTSVTNNQQVNVPTVPGVYMFTIQSMEGGATTGKLIVE